MRYFYDCKLLENGKTIDLISIGIVSSDGREYYAVNSNVEHDRLVRNDWIMQNVVPSLPLRIQPVQHGPRDWSFCLDRGHSAVKLSRRIAQEIQEFIVERDRSSVELWADYGAYDHVAISQLYGRALPANIPMFTHDLQQLISFTGFAPSKAKRQDEHNALGDAKDLKRQYDRVIDEK